MSFNDEIMEADIKGLPSYAASLKAVDEAKEIKNRLEEIIEEESQRVIAG